ncbi:amidohydrolase family protein [Pontibacter korlensis]|uniref:N-acyl-D-amino acid deacylase n=1 Tax=Pontibacter korlensis TaxID=400092 RepID=A0A0E3UYE9_9BACT|nr:amidohydrolase family protein [Pontibacter korlensis]AKD05057.1 N-acyl-D-amino acid deacylase [Pontibacter korlensis]
MTKYNTWRNLFATLAIGALAASCQSPAQQEQDDVTYDLLLKQVSVVDGTGAAPYVANVLIGGDTIALINRDTTVTHNSRKTIQAKGMVVTPGFIDTHAHGDPIKEPEFKNFLAMGVTTIALGQDGFSPNHEDLSVWMDSVDTAKPGVNIAMFAGHNALRVLSGAMYDSIPSEENMKAMEQLVASAMDAGCYGLTTGLEYNPGYYATSNELNRLAKVVGSKNGIVMSHMRNEDDQYVEQAIKELLAQGQYCPVQISHIKVVYGKSKERAQEILQMMDSARQSGTKVTADFYPYTASYTGIAILFPDWAKAPHDYQQVLKTRRAELKAYLKNRIMQRNGPEATLIGSGKYTGKNLKQIAQELNKPFEEVLMDNIDPYGASGAYFIMNEELQEELMLDPHVMICTDGSPSMHHPRGYGAFAKVLETYVVNKKLLSLEEAVRKMTSLPAETIGLKHRGRIASGYKADLLIFNPSEVKENATYEKPHQLASGFRYVLMNGKIVKEGENFTSDREGKVLRKNQQL